MIHQLRRLLSVLVTLPCFWLLNCFPVNAQGKTEQIVTEQQYEEILDNLFHRPEFLASDNQFRIVLRYMPSTHPECQIVIEASSDGAVHEWIDAVSNASVWGTANRYLSEHGSFDARSIAETIRTTRHVVPITSAHARVLLATLFRSMNKSTDELQQDAILLRESGKAVVTIDGTKYEIWFSQLTTEIHWKLMDAEVSDAEVVGRVAIATWMNAVRSDAVKSGHK